MRYIIYMMVCVAFFASTVNAENFFSLKKEENTDVSAEIIRCLDVAIKTKRVAPCNVEISGTWFELLPNGPEADFNALRPLITTHNNMPKVIAAKAIEQGHVKIQHLSGIDFEVVGGVVSFPFTLKVKKQLPSPVYPCSVSETGNIAETLNVLAYVYAMHLPQNLGKQKCMVADDRLYGFITPSSFLCHFSKVLEFATGENAYMQTRKLGKAIEDGVVSVVYDGRGFYKICVMGQVKTWFKFFDATSRVPEVCPLVNMEAVAKAFVRMDEMVRAGRTECLVSLAEEESGQCEVQIYPNIRFDLVNAYLGLQVDEIPSEQTYLNALRGSANRVGAIWFNHIERDRCRIVCGNGYEFPFRMTGEIAQVKPVLESKGRGGILGDLIAGAGNLGKKKEKVQPYTEAQKYVQELIEDEFDGYSQKEAEEELEQMTRVLVMSGNVQKHTQKNSSMNIFADVSEQLRKISLVEELHPRAFHFVDYEAAKSVMKSGEEHRVVKLLKHAMEWRVLELMQRGLYCVVDAPEEADVEQEVRDPHGNLIFLDELRREIEVKGGRVEDQRNSIVGPAKTLMGLMPKFECLSMLYWNAPIQEFRDLVIAGDISGVVNFVLSNPEIFKSRLKDETMKQMELSTLVKRGVHYIRVNPVHYDVVPMLFELWQLQKDDPEGKLSGKYKLKSGLLLNKLVKGLEDTYGPCEQGRTWWDNLNGWVSEAGLIFENAKVKMRFSQKLKEITTNIEAEEYALALEHQLSSALRDIEQVAPGIHRTKLDISELRRKLEAAEAELEIDPSVNLQLQFSEKLEDELVGAGCDLRAILEGRMKSPEEIEADRLAAEQAEREAAREEADLLRRRRENQRFQNNSPQNRGIEGVFRRRISMNPEEIRRLREAGAGLTRFLSESVAG